MSVFSVFSVISCSIRLRFQGSNTGKPFLVSPDSPCPSASIRGPLRFLPFLLLIRNQETSAKVFTEANEQNKDLVILQRVAKKLGLKFRPPLSSSTDFDRRSEAPAENPSVIRVARRFVAWCKRIAIKNQQEQRPRVRASIRIGIRGLLAPPDCKGFRSRSLSPIRVYSWLIKSSVKIC